MVSGKIKNYILVIILSVLIGGLTWFFDFIVNLLDAG